MGAGKGQTRRTQGIMGSEHGGDHAYARVPLGQVTQHVGETVRISGYVHAVRDQGAMQFVILRDRSGKLQVTLRRKDNEEVGEQISSLSSESVVEFVGKVVADGRVNLGGVELVPEAIRVLSQAEDLPVDADSSVDKRLDARHVDLRRPEAQLIFAVQTTAEQAMRGFLIDKGLTEIHSPKLMSAASESGAELFGMDYFGGKAYLAQSPQFYKQMAIIGGMEGVFEIAPVFRAEKSFSARHATEFTSVDVELGFIDSHEDVMKFEEEWLRHTIGAVAQQHGAEIKELLGIDLVAPATPFPRITLADAGEVLKQRGYTLRDKGDLDSTAEQKLCEWAQEQHGHEFVFVTDWPKSLRPFYHMRDGDVTRSFDLLWKGVEVTTGAQREHRHDVLVGQAKEAGVSASVSGYTDFFRHGVPPHGGFGFGLARMLMVMLNQESIRETTLLHRSPNRLTP